MREKNLREERELMRREENKRFILDAAERIFAQKGYSQATVDDIAHEVQFSKATIYRYFESKSAIFSEIIMKSFLEARENFLRIKKKQESAERKIKELIHFILSYYHQKRNIARVLLMERSAMKRVLHIDMSNHVMPLHRKKLIPEDYKRIVHEIFNIMCEIIEEGIEAGEFQNINASDASYVLGSLLRGFQFRGPVHKKDYTIDESTELVHAFFMNGIKRQ
jgi:AcrR family transcriptional regulator